MALAHSDRHLLHRCRAEVTSIAPARQKRLANVFDVAYSAHAPLLHPDEANELVAADVQTCQVSSELLLRLAILSVGDVLLTPSEKDVTLLDQGEPCESAIHRQLKAIVESRDDHRLDIDYARALFLLADLEVRYGRAKTAALYEGTADLNLSTKV